MKYLKEAEEEALTGINKKEGGPFGAAIVDKDGNIIAKAHNKVLINLDPTAHAEIMAIRLACQKLKTKDLSGCTIYTTCEPCPMCLSAIIWSNIDKVYYSSTRKEAEKAGFKDKEIYDYLNGKVELLEIKRIEDKSCDNLLINYKGEKY